MQTLWIHMGTPKTGSTSIQAFLYSNQEALHKKNIHVPLSIARDNPNTTIRHAGVDCLCGNQDGGLSRLLEEMRAYPGHDFIITDEDLGFGQKFVSKMKCDTIRACFPGIAIKSLTYLRRLDSGLQSAFNQRIKSYVYKTPADKLATSKTRALDYRSFVESVQANSLSSFGAAKVLEHAQTVFGVENTIIRLFDKRFLLNDDIVADFFDAIGVDIQEGFTRPEQRNVSPPAAIIPFFMTESIPPQMPIKERRELVELASDTFLLNNTAGEDVKEALKAEMRTLNKQFAMYTATLGPDKAAQKYKDLYKDKEIDLNSPELTPNRYTLYMIRQLNYIYNEARQAREGIAERNAFNILICGKRAVYKKIQQNWGIISKYLTRIRKLLP